MTVKVDVTVDCDVTIDLDKLRKFLQPEPIIQKVVETRIIEKEVLVQTPSSPTRSENKKPLRAKHEFDDVIAGLCAIGFKRGEAKILLDTALKSGKNTTDHEELLAYLVTEGLRHK